MGPGWPCAAAVAALSLAGSVAAGQLGAPLVPPAALPLRTRGRQVVGADGQPVRLACVNWYGAHLRQMVPNGLDQRPIADIARTIAELGFNCVRLPYSLDLVFTGNATAVPDPGTSLAANPDLQALPPLRIFDAAVAALAANGLLVILNNHVSSAGWCCSLLDGEGLWYTRSYPESSWLDALQLMAARYADQPLVAGFDLRNEIRPAGLRSPTWGGGDPSTDWAMAAVKGAQRVVGVNDHMLIIVSGLFYSMFLCRVAHQPIHESEPALMGRTVYTAHEYYFMNFHFLARHLLSAYLVVLAVWTGLLGLWVLAHRCPWHRRCSAGRSAGSPVAAGCCRIRQCELPAAVLLTAASLAFCAGAPPCFQQCSEASLYLGGAFICTALCCGVVSLVLWLRTLLAGARGLLSICRSEGAEADARGLVAGPAGPGAADRGRPLVPAAPEAADLECVPAAVPDCRRPSRRPGSLADVGVACLRKLSKLRARLVAAATVLVALEVMREEYGTYATFSSELDSRWGYLLKGTGVDNSSTTAPVWVGEFGTATDGLWWQHAMRYFREHEVDWAYWSINGEVSPGVAEPYGILLEDAVTIRDAWKLQALQALMPRQTAA